MDCGVRHWLGGRGVGDGLMGIGDREGAVWVVEWARGLDADSDAYDVCCSDGYFRQYDDVGQWAGLCWDGPLLPLHLYPVPVISSSPQCIVPKSSSESRSIVHSFHHQLIGW